MSYGKKFFAPPGNFNITFRACVERYRRVMRLQHAVAKGAPGVIEPRGGNFCGCEYEFFFFYDLGHIFSIIHYYSVS